ISFTLAFVVPLRRNDSQLFGSLSLSLSLSLLLLFNLLIFWRRDSLQFLSNGETLPLRLARLELAESSQAKIIVGTAARLSIFVILVVAAYMLLRYKNGENDASKNDFEPQDILGVNFFQMHTIRTATNNFSSSNELGQGGFGPVYKGNLLDEKEIAVKRLSSSSGQGTEEFMNGITLISKTTTSKLGSSFGILLRKGREALDL
ncbi:unnamed protein product, partial [Brassica rapa subsp. narinosa]